jgi:hypothetical protein
MIQGLSLRLLFDRCDHDRNCTYRLITHNFRISKSLLCCWVTKLSNQMTLYITYTYIANVSIVITTDMKEKLRIVLSEVFFLKNKMSHSRFQAKMFAYVKDTCIWSLWYVYFVYVHTFILISFVFVKYLWPTLSVICQILRHTRQGNRNSSVI